MSDPRYLPPKASLEAVAQPVELVPNSEPIGLGGWLILVAIGLIQVLHQIANVLVAVYWPIFRDGHWEQLTNEDSSTYHVLWAPFIAFEIAGLICLMTLVLITAVHFFRKTSTTPRLAIAVYAFGPIFSVVMGVFGSFLPVGAAPTLDLAELLRSTLVAAIWIPYFLRSKRVKNTFTR